MFRTWETGHFKMRRFKMPRLQTVVFQTVITVASGHIEGQNPASRKRLLGQCKQAYFH